MSHQHPAMGPAGRGATATAWPAAPRMAAPPRLPEPGELTVIPPGQETVLISWLSAAYCAERAAHAISQAEAVSPNQEAAERWLACAAEWRALGCAMSANIAMNRPRDDRDARR